MKPPIFIIGSPRSGTTLFRLMITAHPAILVPPECGFAVWWLKKYGDWKAEDADSRLAGFIDDLRSSRKIETWNLDYDGLARWIVSKRPATYAQLVSLVYQAYGEGTGRTFERWGDKNNFYIQHIPEIHALFPEAMFLHIVRDGRDVACSYRELGRKQSSSSYAPKLPMEVERIAEEWSGNVQAAITAFEHVPSSQWKEIRYEDLVADSAGVLADVCAFLGEPYSPQMLDYHRFNREQQLEPAEFLNWKAKTLEPPTTGQVGRFASELTTGERATFEAVAHGVLKRYRYL